MIYDRTQQPVLMFHDHFINLFGTDIDAWLESHGVDWWPTSHGSDDDSPEDGDLAFELQHSTSGGLIVFTASGEVVDNNGFPTDLLQQLLAMVNASE